MGVLKKKKEKPRPRECACGKAPILVSVRGGTDAELPGSGEVPGKS